MVANKNYIFIFSLNIRSFLTVFTSKLLFSESLFKKCNKNDYRSDKLYLGTYLYTPPTGLPLTSHDWDSIDISGTDHCCTVVLLLLSGQSCMMSQEWDSINYLWDWPFLLAFVRRRNIKAAGKFENYDWP